MRFWIREGTENKIVSKRRYSTKLEYSCHDSFPDLLFSDVSDKNELFARAADSELVKGEIRPWDAVRDVRCLYVIVEPTQLSPNSLVMSAYLKEHVLYHKHKKLISQKMQVEREDLLPGKNIVERAFLTFDFIFGQRVKTGYNPQLVLYDPDGQLDEFGNMSNPISIKDLPAAILAKRTKDTRLSFTQQY